MEIFVSFCIIVGPLLGIYFIWNSFDNIPFNVHKSQNKQFYPEFDSHSDLSRFISEFESVKSILGISKKYIYGLTNGCHASLFRIDLDRCSHTSINGNLFIINNIKYIAKNKSDYKKATKIIRNHYNHCKENNIYCNWI